MSDILIKGIEMPKNCKECLACKAELSQEKKVIYVCCFAQTDCPLIELPPHGRLIEAERLKEVFHRNVASGEAFDQLIDIAPTIIEAEEGEI